MTRVELEIIERRTAREGIAAAMRLVHKTALDAGWYRRKRKSRGRRSKALVQRNFGEVIALVHSELSEALEAHRRDLKDDKLPHRSGVEVELADCVIRIFDTAAALKLDLAGAIIEKNQFNKTRADHKPSNRRRKGGKKY